MARTKRPVDEPTPSGPQEFKTSNYCQDLRRCWSCGHPMKATEELEYRGTMRWLKCPICKAKTLWPANPVMNGGPNQVHYDGQGYGSLSMLHDPSCKTFTGFIDHKRFADPRCFEFGSPLFAYDDDGNKTHRWHWRRAEWIMLARAKKEDKKPERFHKKARDRRTG